MRSNNDSRALAIVHRRELATLIKALHNKANVGIIDFVSGEAIFQNGSEFDSRNIIEDSSLKLLGQSIFGRHGKFDVSDEELRKLCSSLGGIDWAIFEYKKLNCFIGYLPQKKTALWLIFSHDNEAGQLENSLMIAKSIQSNLSDLIKSNPKLNLPDPSTNSASLWKNLLHLFSAKSSAQETTINLHSKSTSQLNLLCSPLHHISAAYLVDLEKNTISDTYGNNILEFSDIDQITLANSTKLIFDGNFELAFEPVLGQLGQPSGPPGKVQIKIGGRMLYWLRVPGYPHLHIPFDKNRALVLVKDPRPNPALDWIELDRTGLSLLKLHIGELLMGGMKTQMFPFPNNAIEFQEILDNLKELPEDDLVGRLDIAGFAAHPVELGDINQRCKECIYYLPHRGWCDLPELPVPVEPNWWCRLWKL